MATTPVTPAVSAPAAPAATPTPAAPSTPSTPVATPSTPAQPMGIEERLQQGWAKAKESVAKAGDERATDEPAAATAGSEEVKLEATTLGDQPAAGKEETPVEGEQPEVAEPAAEEEIALSLDDAEPLGPKALADVIKGNPEAEKFFNDNPELKSSVFAALRRDAENREIRQFVPDVETAKLVTTAAAQYQQVDNLFLAATTPESADKFVNTWAREALILGDDGQPKLDANGKYQFHPALSYTLDRIAQNKLSVLEEHAKASGNEELQNALGLVREAMSPSSPGLDDIPEDLKPYADSLKARETALETEKAVRDRQARESAEAANTQSIDRAETKAAESVQRQLQPSFTKAGLSKFETEAAIKRIGEEIDQKLAAHPLYQSIYDSILQQQPGEAREKALTKHCLKFANEFLGPIAARVIREAKGGTLERQAAKQSTVAAQRVASRTDPKGTSTSVPQPRPVDAKSTLAAIKTEHPDWDHSQLVAESFKRYRASQPRTA